MYGSFIVDHEFDHKAYDMLEASATVAHLGQVLPMNSHADALTIADAVTCHATARPTAVAFLCGDESLSFAELECRSNAVAHGLLAADIRPGAHVAYLGCINW